MKSRYLQYLPIFLLFILSFSTKALDTDIFRNFLKEEKEKLKNQKYKKLKLEVISKAEKFLNKKYEEILKDFKKSSFKLKIDKDVIYTEIVEIFKGKPEDIINVYISCTIGKRKPNIFIESGAGLYEEIEDLKQLPYGYEFITNRVYKSNLAYNTKAKIRLLFFKIDEKRYVVVNQMIEDYGEILRKNKVKWHKKPYYEIKYDLTIDFYTSFGKNDEFYTIYNSFSAYEGQGLKSRYKALNILKGAGNIFSFGLLGKKIKNKVKKESKKVWEKRSKIIQELVLKEKKDES